MLPIIALSEGKLKLTITEDELLMAQAYGDLREKKLTWQQVLEVVNKYATAIGSDGRKRIIKADGREEGKSVYDRDWKPHGNQ